MTDDFELALLRQGFVQDDLIAVRATMASPVLVFCSICGRSAKQPELLACDHVACPGKYHLDCLRTKLQELHEAVPGKMDAWKASFNNKSLMPRMCGS